MGQRGGEIKKALQLHKNRYLYSELIYQTDREMNHPPLK